MLMIKSAFIRVYIQVMSIDSPESSSSSSEEDSNQDILNEILEAIRHSSSDIDFPNYFNELHTLGYEGEDIELTEKFIESVLKRIRIPHIHEGKTTSENYFEHIAQKAQELAKEQGIEVKLYVCGGR